MDSVCTAVGGDTYVAGTLWELANTEPNGSVTGFGEWASITPSACVLVCFSEEYQSKGNHVNENLRERDLSTEERCKWKWPEQDKIENHKASSRQTEQLSVHILITRNITDSWRNLKLNFKDLQLAWINKAVHACKSARASRMWGEAQQRPRADAFDETSQYSIPAPIPSHAMLV
uniref:Uncharacterized protein n=1 Tax=Oryza glumipatula TaxID=40148 RepID=A0A0D9YX76_9ORYZ